MRKRCSALSDQKVKYMAVAVAVAVSGGGAVAVAVAVSGGGAVAVAVAGLTKKIFNYIQKDFLINVWGYRKNIFLTCIVRLSF